MPPASRRAALLAAILMALCGFTTASHASEARQEDAGRYWVSVAQEKGPEFTIAIGLVAKEPVRIRVTRVPNFVDASALPRQKEVLPLFSAEFLIPLKFVAEGRGTLFVEIRSTGQTDRRNYLAFDLFSSSGGGDAGKVLEGYHALWQKASKAPSLQLGDKKIACGPSLLAGARQTGVISSGRHVSGVVFIGLTGDLDKNPTGVNPDDWGLVYDTGEGAGLVGSLVALGEERQTQQAEQTRTDETSGSQSGRQQTTSGRTETQGETRSGGESKEAESKPKEEPKPASGPYAGATRSGAIASFSSVSQGRFGETTTTATPEFERLKQLDKAELVLKIKHSERGAWASGRVFINTERSVQPKQDRGSCWYGDQRGGQEEFLGDIQVDYDGEEIRFDITSWVKRNKLDTYYVIVENLARGGELEVQSAYIKFKGVL